jgi:3-oxoacyl-[acyl-carrier protein] reductase
VNEVAGTSSTDGFFLGRTVIVTGSSQGIGLAIARAAARRGARVVVNGRSKQNLVDAVDQIARDGGEARYVVGGIARDGTAQALVDEAHAAFGRIDLLVNNVGVSAAYGPLLEAERGAFEKTMTGNTWPALDLVQRAVRGGLGEHGGGAVLNVSTIGSQQVQPFAGVYSASKAALELLTRVLARELAPRGVRVNAVAPGLVRAGISTVLTRVDGGEAERRLTPLGRLGEPRDIAQAALFLLSDEASWITGTTLTVDGGRLLVGDEPAGYLGALPLGGTSSERQGEWDV